MKPLDRNISILRHIVTCCEQIEQTVERFGNSADVLAADPYLSERRCTVYSANW